MEPTAGRQREPELGGIYTVPVPPAEPVSASSSAAVCLLLAELRFWKGSPHLCLLGDFVFMTGVCMCVARFRRVLAHPCASLWIYERVY